MKRLLAIIVLSLSLAVAAAAQNTTIIKIDNNEYWWGGVVAYGARMPYVEPLDEFDLASKNNNNQVVPLLLSNKGRYVWSDRPFTFEVRSSEIIVKSEYEKIEPVSDGTTLRDAYLSACDKHFKPTGELPDTLFFAVPQYNTWIELMYDQNERDIMNYARGILDNGFPAGVLMIDDNWQKHYGNFDFKPEKFPAPRTMVDSLHAMGFKVMLWICPFVSPDSPEFRDLNAKGYLIKDKKGGAAIIRWWNGYSACYDFTNPAASSHFILTLKKMQADYGIDGFKFDAGDNNFYYNDNLVSWKKDATSVDHTEAWARIGLEFPFNEYRAGWRMGGEPLVQRLGDKNHSWGDLQALIPQMIAAGLMGYSYACPDMIGGGQYRSFHNVDPSRIDRTLVVRSAQVHALMPMMQFSVAPWRILDGEEIETVRKMAVLHEKMGDYIMECAHISAVIGEPIVRHMEYSFPGEGFEQCNDQFMLGWKYMVAPVVTAENRRKVKLPKGRWRDDLGRTHNGGRTIIVDASLARLPYFEKIR